LVSDEKRILIDLRKAKLEAEHRDLLETRNGLMIAEFTIPLAFLTLVKQLGLIADNLILGLVALLTATAWAVFDSSRRDFSTALRRKRSEIEGLLSLIRD
jgi:hypothetical protein